MPVPGPGSILPIMRRALPLLVALLLVAACGSGEETPGADASSPPTSHASTTSAGTEWRDVLEEGGEALPVADADWLQVVGGSVWTTLSQPQGGVAQQLDATTGEPLASVDSPADTCTAMDVGYGDVWAVSCTDPSTLMRIDGDTGRLVDRIDVGGAVPAEGSVASGEGSVWVVRSTPSASLVRIDPASDRVVATTRLRPGVAGVRAGLGGLWATDPARGQLLRLDLRTGETVVTVDVGSGARFFDVGEGAVWVQNNVDGTVSRVDPRTNSVVATIEVDDGAVEGGDLAVGGGFVWARVSSWLVSKIDPATNEVVARYGPPAGSGSVAAGDDALWISAHDVDLVYRLPLR